MKNVGITGFEPMITDPESVVLPLYYIPIKSISLLYYIYYISLWLYELIRFIIPKTLFS